jgi:hypothetical protein
MRTLNIAYFMSLLYDCGCILLDFARYLLYSLKTLAILLARFKLAGFIKQWGLLSLEIFVSHSIATAILRTVLQRLFGFTEPFLHLMLGTAIGIYAPIAFEQICRRIRFPYMFTLRPRRI